MALTLRDCTFFGSALSESFALNDLEGVLTKEKLLEKLSGTARRELEEGWEAYRRKLRSLGDQGGALRVRHHVLDPLAARLGYGEPRAADAVQTREDEEDGGFLYSTESGAKLRAWAVDLGTDLDAPNRRGRAYRFSPARVAERVLLAAGERVGLLTDGEELRVIIVDPARPGSHVAVGLGRSGGWRGSSALPDSYRLVRTLVSPAGIESIGAITEAARLAQTRVTKSLRDQARRAVEGFVQALLDNPTNVAALAEWPSRDVLARTLWREGLVVVYRLLFILKLEASADPARAFSFASTSLWRNTYSPNVALAPVVKEVVERGAVTGFFLADSLRATFRLFSEGLSSSELKVSPLGGMLFGVESAPLVSRLAWTEEGVAALLDNLLWTRERGEGTRARVHYGSLDVEDLGRVYEALLELDPGIASQPMCRLRRAKLEVVVEAAKGEPYRAATGPEGDGAEDSDSELLSADDDVPERGKAKTTWVEEIPKARFFLRVGLGRKATGSFYTPHPFVRFLVQETLASQVAERSPGHDPRPEEVLKLKVLDPAMGSGHFLVEACRFLGEKLYEATRLCDGLAAEAEGAAAAAKDRAEQERLIGRARELRHRVEVLPDPNDELVAYLPSRAAEGGESGLSQSRALAICRRLVAVHCLYGVDKNPLAVELAKVSLWLESYAEGLPLTFLDHRLLCGDSLAGPLSKSLLVLPRSGQPLNDLFSSELRKSLSGRLQQAMRSVGDLEATVGKDVADLERKRAAKACLDEQLAPFRRLAQHHAQVAREDEEGGDGVYEAVARRVADGGDPGPASPEVEDALSFDLVFPEVFFPGGETDRRGGFDAVLSNPPWEKPHAEVRSLLAAFDLEALALRNSIEIEERAAEVFRRSAEARTYWERIQRDTEASRRVVLSHVRRVEREVKASIGAAHVDAYLAFLARSHELLASKGALGMLLSGGFAKNPAGVPLRLLWMRFSSCDYALQFDNRERLFADLPTILEFSLLVARRGELRAEARAKVALGLVDFRALESVRLLPGYPVPRTGSLLTFSDILRGEQVATRSSWRFIEALASPLIQEVYPSRDNTRLVEREQPGAKDCRLGEDRVAVAVRGMCPLLEGRSIRQFDGLPEVAKNARWSPVPTQLAVLAEVPPVANRARYYRLALRRKCGSPKSNERSVVAAVIPPGLCCSDSLIVEEAPHRAPNYGRLVLMGVLNSFTVDALVRPRVQVMISKKLLEDTEGPADLETCASTLVAHSALRLLASHQEYEPLWNEQVQGLWRESEGKRARFPVLVGDNARWGVRCAVDAVVADAHGLDRAQYERVLVSFSHRSFPAARDRCLEAYDELRRVGLSRFCKKHDPYFDIPLVQALPAPIIDLPIPTEAPLPIEVAKGRGRGVEAGVGQLTLGEVQMAAEPVAGATRKPKKNRH